MSRALLVVAWLAASATGAHGYGMGPALSLDALVAKADIACKGVATADKPVKDAWFSDAPGYSVHETALQIVSCVKGSATGLVRFRHYVEGPPAPNGFTPPHVELTVGRAYLVFAAKESAGGAYRIVEKWPSMKIDVDAILAADALPHARGATIEDVVWHELHGLVTSADPKDIVEGVRQLDEFSGGRMVGVADFLRPKALVEIAAALASRDPAVVVAAIDVFGEDSPIYRDDDAGYWLAGLPGASIAGLVERKIAGGQGAELAVTPLVRIADGAALVATPDARARAIRAVGRVQSGVAMSKLKAWARDPDAEVRAAAVIASSERVDRSLVIAGLADPSDAVRAAAALGVGFSRDGTLVGKLVPLLRDSAGRVRENAAMSVLAFPVDVAKPALVAGLATDYRSLFVNVLAKPDVVPYLKTLGEVIANQEQPRDWWGGRVPAADSWALVFAYARARPPAELAAGTHDAALDALEKMHWYSSSEPRDLYALYVVRNLTARARRFRASFAGSALVDAKYLDEVDRNPRQFVR